MRREQRQSNTPQSAESTTEISKPPKVKHVMPGLCPEIAHEFRRKKNLIPTASTVAMNCHVQASAVFPALFYTIFEHLAGFDLRLQRSERRISEMSVREYQQIHRVA